MCTRDTELLVLLLHYLKHPIVHKVAKLQFLLVEVDRMMIAVDNNETIYTYAPDHKQREKQKENNKYNYLTTELCVRL